MALTKLQKIVLQRYQAYRLQPPTFLGLLQQAWEVEVSLIILCGIVVWYAYSSHMYAAAYFIGGLLVGALARDVATFRRVLQIWPALSQVLDWQRVEQVIKQELKQEQSD